MQHGRRANSIVKNMLLHARGGLRRASPGRHQRARRGELNLAYHGTRAEKREFNITLEKSGSIRKPERSIFFPQEIVRVLLNLISNGFYATAKRSVEAKWSPMSRPSSATTRGPR